MSSPKAIVSILKVTAVWTVRYSALFSVLWSHGGEINNTNISSPQKGTNNAII